MNVKPLLVLIMLVAVVAAVGCGQSSNATSGAAKPDPQVAKSAAPVTPVTVAEAKQGSDAQGVKPGSADPAPPPAAEPPAAKEEPEEPLPEVVAKIGDEVITGKELQAQLDHMKKAMMGRGPANISPQQQRQFLDKMINEKILGSQAKNAGISVTEEEVKSKFQEARERGKLKSDEEFKKYLDSIGISEEELMGQLRQNMIINKFIEEKTKDLKATDEELNAEYEKMKAGGALDRKEETTDVAHILVQVGKDADQAAWDKAKEKIDAARARIVKGEKFADLAKEVSDDPGSKNNGGAYPDTPKGMMLPEFDAIMLATPVGSVSEPFKTQFGWHILTVTGKRPVGTKTLDDVKDRINQRLLMPKKQQALKSLVEEARNSMKVEILLPEPPPEPVKLPGALQVAPGGAANAPTPAPPSPPPASKDAAGSS